MFSAFWGQSAWNALPAPRIGEGSLDVENNRTGEHNRLRELREGKGSTSLISTFPEPGIE